LLLRGAEAPLFHGAAGIFGLLDFRDQSRTKIKVKGVGQEYPTHTLQHNPRVNGIGQEFPIHLSHNNHNFALRRRRALAITETELKLIAAAAKMGLSSRPKNG
jgi:hypothetical protein